MKNLQKLLVLGIFAITSSNASFSAAQITDHGVDDVLNAPYRGPIESLRLRHSNIGFGEVQPHVEPLTNNAIDGTVRIWCSDTWDRSILRLYQGLDASGPEVNLVGHADYSTAVILPADGFPFRRFSFKAMAAKSLCPTEYEITFDYFVVGGTRFSSTHTIKVGPTEGSFDGELNLRESFLRGTPILQVNEGNASVSLPIGRTAGRIGAAFYENDKQLGPESLANGLGSSITKRNVLFPWASESVYIAHDAQFQLGGPSSGPSKQNYGSPWPGHLIGYHFSADLYGPSGWAYRSSVTIREGLNRFESHLPLKSITNFAGIPDGATLFFFEDANNPNNTDIDLILDQADNIISFERVGGDVTDIKVVETGSSFKHHWELTSDPQSGFITGVYRVDIDNPGTVEEGFQFEYEELVNVNSPVFGRAKRVQDINDQALFEFYYFPGSDPAMPNEIRLVREFDEAANAMRAVVEYMAADSTGNPDVAGTDRLTKSYFGADSNDFFQSHLIYETDSNKGTRLKQHRLALNSGGNPSQWAITSIEYSDDIQAGDDPGFLLPARVTSPEGQVLEYEYDTDIDGGSFETGLLSKRSTGGSLTHFDAKYDFTFDEGSSPNLYFYPRIVEICDGRGPTTARRFIYEEGGVDENGDGVTGELSNHLLARFGPVVTSGPTDLPIGFQPHQAHTDYTYAQSGDAQCQLIGMINLSNQGNIETQLTLDETLQVKKSNLISSQDSVSNVTRRCDKQDLVVIVDPDGFVTQTWLDAMDRPLIVRKYLSAITGFDDPAWDVDCGAAANNSESWSQFEYVEQAFEYDTKGRLTKSTIDNKDGNGDVLDPPIIRVRIERDDAGARTETIVDSGDGSPVLSTFTEIFNPDGRKALEFDQHGRGATFVHFASGSANGYHHQSTPLAAHTNPESLSGAVNEHTMTIHTDRANRQVSFATFGQAGRPKTSHLYNAFGQLEAIVVESGSSEPSVVTHYQYDDASNVTRKYITQGSIRNADVLTKYDELSRPYEIRRRTVANSSANALVSDRVTKILYDDLGRIEHVFSSGDASVTLLFTSFEYDPLGRISRISDSTGAELLYEDFDRRGNPTTIREKLNNSEYATTNLEYDAFGRVVKVTHPADYTGARHYSETLYDSRGHVIRTTTYESDDTPVSTMLAAFDALGRITRQVITEDPDPQLMTAADASPLLDRITDYEYDAAGNFVIEKSYQDFSGTPIITTTNLDGLGRIESVVDPLGNSLTNSYISPSNIDTGRLQKTIFDNGNDQAIETIYTYDGFDQVLERLLSGGTDTPTRLTRTEYNGFGQLKRQVNPKGIVTVFDYNVGGDLIATTEDKDGPTQRVTNFKYNRLGHLIRREIMNSDAVIQRTFYRYDPKGRLLAALFPDSTSTPSDVSSAIATIPTDCLNPMADDCEDAIRMGYDVAGRMTDMVDQRGAHTTFQYSQRGLLRHETTTFAGEQARNTYTYDPLERMIRADRGTPSDTDAVSSSEFSYTALGDMTFEKITLGRAGNVPYQIDYDHDQAGNLKAIDYAPTMPNSSGVSLRKTHLYGGAPNNLLLTLNGGSEQTLLNYTYKGNRGGLIDKRTISAPNASNTFELSLGYDRHGLVDQLSHKTNAQLDVDFMYGRDLNGNVDARVVDPASRTEFSNATRVHMIDNLDRIRDSMYGPDGNFRTETTTYDRLGNRISHQARKRNLPTQYQPVNAANEYTQIGGGFVQYDDAGNIAVDTGGRNYFYDERNLLIKVTNADESIILGEFDYDAHGRRIYTKTDEEILYYYAGSRVIEERNASDHSLRRFHIYGDQYIDERIATYDAATDSYLFYITDQNFSTIGILSEDGDTLQPVDFSIWGAFDAPRTRYDADEDGDIDFEDAQNLVDCLLNPVDLCLEYHDANGDMMLDEIDLAAFAMCMGGPGVAPASDCMENLAAQPGTSTGDITLHGLQVIRLTDGKLLLDARTRTYDPELGRFLQRDSAGYVDGNNLYEAFIGNPVAYLDPSGQGIIGELLTGDNRANGMQIITDTIDLTLIGFASDSIELGSQLYQGVRYIGGKRDTPSDLQQRYIDVVDTEYAMGGTGIDDDSSLSMGTRATFVFVNDLNGLNMLSDSAHGSRVIYGGDQGAFEFQMTNIERASSLFGGISALSLSAAIGSGLSMSSGQAALARAPGLIPARLLRITGQRGFANRLRRGLMNRYFAQALNKTAAGYGKSTVMSAVGVSRAAFRSLRVGPKQAKVVSRFVSPAGSSGFPTVTYSPMRLFPNRGDISTRFASVQRLVQGSDGFWYTVGTNSRWKATGSFDFATFSNGSIFVTRHAGHTGVTMGYPVRYAGQIRFGSRGTRSAGRLRRWNNQSGHYRPPEAFKHQAGLPLDSYTSWNIPLKTK